MNPAAGTYTVVRSTVTRTADPSTFTLFAWVLGSTAAGNMTVAAPANAELGKTGAIDLTFSGLTAGTKYLGSVGIRRCSRHAESHDRSCRPLILLT